MDFRTLTNLTAACCLALLTACSDEAGPVAQEAQAEIQQPITQSNIVVISAEEYGPEWPFSEEEMHLICLPGNAVVVADIVTGDTYPINGPAKAQSNMQPLEHVWLDSPDLPGTKYSVGPLIEQGLGLCAG